MHDHRMEYRFSLKTVAIIVYVLATILGATIARGEEPHKHKNPIGCHINALSVDDGKETKTMWQVVGWAKPPNVKIIEDDLGKFEDDEDAWRKCKEWRERMKKILPIPLGEPPENGKKEKEVRYARQ